MLCSRKYAKPFITATLSAMLGFIGQPAQAQNQAPIRLIVPFSPGGSADASARAIAVGMENVLKQTVVVENKPGAAGFIGAGVASQAGTGGNTLFLTTDGMESNPTVDRKKAKAIFSKLVTVASIADAPLVLAASVKFPASNIPELIKLAQKRATPLTYAIPGVGTTHQLAGALLADRGKFNLRAIPYRGTAAGVADVASGVVDLQFGNLPSIKPMVDAGRMKILGVTSLRPYELLPGTPTISSTIEGYKMEINLGLMAPAGIAPKRLAQLSDAVRQALHTDKVRDMLHSEGLEPAYRDAAQYAQYLKDTSEARKPLFRLLGFKAD